MFNIPKMLSLVLILASFNVLANDEYPHSVSCDSINNFVENLNDSMMDDTMFLVKCTETYDEEFFGLVKKNYKSKIELTSNRELCSNPIGVKNLGESPALDYSVVLGVSPYHADKILNIFYNYGVEFKTGAFGTQVGTMYDVRQIRLPVCQ